MSSSLRSSGQLQAHLLQTVLAAAMDDTPHTDIGKLIERVRVITAKVQANCQNCWDVQQEQLAKGKRAASGSGSGSDSDTRRAKQARTAQGEQPKSRFSKGGLPQPPGAPEEVVCKRADANQCVGCGNSKHLWVNCPNNAGQVPGNVPMPTPMLTDLQTTQEVSADASPLHATAMAMPGAWSADQRPIMPGHV